MTTHERAAFWHEQLTAWLSSQLSGPAFCKHHALSYHQFSYWRRKLARPQPEMADTPAGFARVTLPPSLATDPGLTLTFPNGITLSGLHLGNIDLLGPIMRQL